MEIMQGEQGRKLKKKKKENKFLSENETSENHLSTQTIKMDLSEDYNEDTEFNKVLSKFGITAVLAKRGNYEISDSNVTGSIEITVVVSYTIDKRAKGEFVKITKVKSSLVCFNGRNTPGSGISIKSNKIRIGSMGVYSGGGQNVYKDYNLAKNAYTGKTLVPPSSWLAVSVETATIGATQTVTLTRGKRSKWYLELTCNPYSTSWSWQYKLYEYHYK